MPLLVIVALALATYLYRALVAEEGGSQTGR